MNRYSLKPIHIKSRVLSYLLAILSSVLFIAIKLKFTELIGVSSPFLLAELFVIFVAYFLGRGPALVSILINTLLVDYFFVFPLNSIDVFSVSHVLQNVVYIIQSLLVVLFIHRLKNSQGKLFTMTEQLEVQVQNRTKSLRETSLQLENSNKELQRSNRELEDFAYIASHDLQEPLRKIQSFGNLLNEEYGNTLDKEGKMYLDRMLNASNRMRTLINDLLSYSRVATKTLPFKKVNLSIIIQEVITDLETKINETKATIRVDKLPTIEADPMQIRQLFQNLLSNSLKFSRPEELPVITISSKSGKKHVSIHVQDNGIGIDPKYTYKIFTIFERLHGKNEYEGTGIGLAVVKKIIDRHNGSIHVESQPNKGTTFTIRLPIKQPKGTEL